MSQGAQESELDHGTVAAVRAAATGLSGQDGRGVPRSLVIELAASTRRPVTILDGEPPIAVIHQPRAGGSTTFDGLTTREREVAQLVARGLSNQQIARQLVISVGTVKDHVHRILSKTGLASRAAVGAAWRG